MTSQLGLTRNIRGFTLIELLIVIAIVGILAAIAIPVYKGQTTRAKMTEVTNSIGTVASAIGTAYQTDREYPPGMANPTEISNNLGVALPVDIQPRIESMSTNANGQIIATITNIDSNVNGKTIVLTPTTGASGAIFWDWTGGSVVLPYLPRR